MSIYSKLVNYYSNEFSIFFDEKNCNYTFFGNYGKRVTISVNESNNFVVDIYFGILKERLVYSFESIMSPVEYEIFRNFSTNLSSDRLFDKEKLSIVSKLISNNPLMFVSENDLINAISLINKRGTLSFKKDFVEKDLHQYTISDYNFHGKYIPFDIKYFFTIENGKLLNILSLIDSKDFTDLNSYTNYPSTHAYVKFYLMNYVKSKAWKLVYYTNDFKYELSYNNKYYQIRKLDFKNSFITVYKKSYDKDSILNYFCLEALKNNKNMLNVKTLQLIEEFGFKVETMSIEEYQSLLMYEY